MAKRPAHQSDDYERIIKDQSDPSKDILRCCSCGYSLKQNSLTMEPIGHLEKRQDTFCGKNGSSRIGRPHKYETDSMARMVNI